jgi:hypothetical protein
MHFPFLFFAFLRHLKAGVWNIVVNTNAPMAQDAAAAYDYLSGLDNRANTIPASPLLSMPISRKIHRLIHTSLSPTRQLAGPVTTFPTTPCTSNVRMCEPFAPKECLLVASRQHVGCSLRPISEPIPRRTARSCERWAFFSDLVVRPTGCTQRKCSPARRWPWIR